MNARDTAAILAGLRLLQSQMFMLGGPGTVGDIATDGGTLPMPTAEYIDDLVAILNRDVEINVTPPTAPDDDGAGDCCAGTQAGDWGQWNTGVVSRAEHRRL